MSNQIKRWSKHYEANQAAEESMSDSSATHTYKVSLNDIAWMLDELHIAVNKMKGANYDASVCQEACLAFHKECWKELYGGSNEDLYAGEGGYYIDYDSLLDLTDRGYDVRPQWRRFRDILKEIWVLLPDFYKGDSIRNLSLGHDNWNTVSTPKDYDPNKPFPNLPPVPSDID